MPQPSRRSHLVPFSPIRAMFRLADEMDRAGKGPVIRFHVGDPDFAPPDAVVEETYRAMRAGKTHYPQSVGIHELRLALTEKVTSRNRLAAAWDQIVVAPGSTEALIAVMEVALHPGDEILLPEVYWPNYVQQALLASAKAVFYPLGRGYQPDVAGTRARITPRTRCILINSPSNPTGAVIPEATLRALYDLAREHDLWVVSDEAYEDIVFDAKHVSVGSFERDVPDSERRVFSLFTFSKSYAMTGFRLGYIVAPNLAMGTILRKTQEPLVGSTAAMIQWGGLAALRDDAPVAAMRDAYRRRRDLAVGMLREAGLIDYTPEGAFYVLADIASSGLTGEAFAKELLEEERVCVAPAAGFALALDYGDDGLPSSPLPAGASAPDYPVNPKARHLVRIAFCVSDENVKEGIARLVRFVARCAERKAAGARA
jgi:aspartate aminotransferase